MGLLPLRRTWASTPHAENARVKFAAQTRSEMQGEKCETGKWSTKNLGVGKCEKNKLRLWLMYTVS